MEEAAAGREESLQVPVRRLLPGAPTGVHEEMVSERARPVRSPRLRFYRAAAVSALVARHQRLGALAAAASSTPSPAHRLKSMSQESESGRAVSE